MCSLTPTYLPTYLCRCRVRCLTNESIEKSAATNDDDNDDDENKKCLSNIREARKRLTKADFEALAMIGRGAFGEVRLVRKRDTGEVGDGVVM